MPAGTDRTIINIQSDLYSGSLLWEAAQAYPHMLRKFAFLARLCTLSSTNSDTYCRHCHLAMQGEVEHFFIDCTSLQLRRELFWNTVTDNFVRLNSPLIHTTCQTLLSRVPLLADGYRLLIFLTIICCYLISPMPSTVHMKIYTVDIPLIPIMFHKFPV